jgi:hypothetical protein
MQDLSMQIRLFGYIAVNQADSPYAGADEISCSWTTQAAHAHNEHAGILQP